VGLHVIEPCGYLDMIALLRACRGVLTDSGGLQKEAYLLGRSCVVFRAETEWVELVSGGHVRLVGADRARIVAAAASLPGPVAPGTRDLYGDGRAGERIVEALARRPAPAAGERLSTRSRP
jgi:UDP-GlcNAc3NAcA epimerase